MSFRSTLDQSVRRFAVLLGLVALSASVALAHDADASMKGSYYQTQLKAKKSKSAAAKATKAAMKGVKGFYGFKLKSKDIPAKNGTLVWSKKGSNNRPEASRTDVVLYSSDSFPGNRKIVVSGTVMIPKGKAPAGGWPVISWAHGTVGLADQCAPSRLLGRADDFDYGSGDLIGDWLAEGYAVVATDYEGLGTPGIHPYLVGDSEGRGALDIVLAARQLNPSLSKDVVLTGHSQGGQAILFAAKLAETSWGRGANYLGTVSYAPASNLDVQAPLLSTLTSYGLSSLALSILRGMVVADPSIKARDLLTDEAWKVYPKVDTLCSDQLTAATEQAGLRPASLLKPGWENTPNGRRFESQLIKQNPAVKVGAPVMIPQGTADDTVQPTFTQLLVSQLTPLNPGLISYETFDGADHSTVLERSKPKVDPFIAGLFGG